MGNETSKPDFSDVQGGASSTAPETASSAKADFSDVQGGVASTAPDAAAQTYTVASGDSLSKIAKHVYGNANEWHRIFDANRDQLDNPDHIAPGQTLKIPAKA